MFLLQIAPHSKFEACGLSDYAGFLAAAWRDEHGMQTAYLAASGPASLRLCLDNGEERRVEADKAFAPTVEAVVLQYSGYGYAKRGAPWWLVTQMARWRRARPDVRWITMFHEVAANGSPLTGAFWMRWLQLHVARRLMKYSDVVMTNCTGNAAVLEGAQGGGGELLVWPVFSNLGESAHKAPLEFRDPHLLLFTSQLSGKGMPETFWQDLDHCIVSHGILKLILIGRPYSGLPALSCEVQQVGFVSPAEASGLLAGARFGFAFLGPHMFAKSGIFAAYAAHGVVPLVPTNEAELPDGLAHGRHYLRVQDGARIGQVQKLEWMSAELQKWYAPHNLNATAALYLAHAREGTPEDASNLCH